MIHKTVILMKPFSDPPFSFPMDGTIIILEDTTPSRIEIVSSYDNADHSEQLGRQTMSAKQSHQILSLCGVRHSVFSLHYITHLYIEIQLCKYICSQYIHNSKCVCIYTQLFDCVWTKRDKEHLRILGKVCS